MPPAVGLAVSAGASMYGANRASKASKQASETANMALDRRQQTSYGSYLNQTRNNVHVPGYSSLDPRIRSLREMALGRLPDYRTSLEGASGLVQSRLGETRDELASNENPFIQARVNPLLARAAEARGSLSRGLTRRGLAGSSLYSSGLGNYDAQVGREIGDQRALATSEALASRIGLDTQIYNSAVSSVQALQGLDAQEQSIAAQNLAQELSTLGLGQADINGILGAAGLQMDAGQLKNETFFRGLDSIGRSIEEYRKPSLGDI